MSNICDEIQEEAERLLRSFDHEEPLDQYQLIVMMQSIAIGYLASKHGGEALLISERINEMTIVNAAQMDEEIPVADHPALKDARRMVEQMRAKAKAASRILPSVDEEEP